MPPRQRMEPEYRAIKQGEPLNEWIVPPDVLALVQQDRIELSLRPLAPLFRKDRHWTKPAHGDRRRA